MKRSEWASLFANQPPGLSGSELARRLKMPSSLTLYWCKRLKYRMVDGRKNPSPDKFKNVRKVNPKEIDWSLSNQAIASKHGVRRQTIWKLRKRVINLGTKSRPVMVIKTTEELPDLPVSQ